jgi:5-methylcytosine-specific restriction endonuclease McrA
MKRLNPDTGKPFEQGCYRDDGYRFWNYRLTKIAKKTGYFYETWRSPKQYNLWIKNMKYVQQKWAKNNPAKTAAKSMKRRSSKLNRTPPWLTAEHFAQIQDMYNRAKIAEDFTSEKWHVDHIIPLQGKNVSGLHVPWNLQIMSALKNRSKGNKHVC